MRRITVSIGRSERESAQISVGAWEVDILRLVHGPQHVQVVGNTTDGNDYPDPQVEFERLCKRYGEDRENGGAPFAAQIFGAMGASRVAELMEHEQAIEDGTYVEPVAAPVAQRQGKQQRKVKVPAAPQAQTIDE